MTAARKKIGDIAVTAVSDGVLSTSLDVVIGLERAEAERLAGKKAGEPVEIAVNAFLLELDGVRALIDTGAGNTMGPTLGKLADSLRAAGTPPERIDTICSPICIPTIPTDWSTTTIAPSIPTRNS